MGGVASGIDTAVYLAGGFAAAAASAGVGQSHRPQDTRAGAVVVRAWRDAALHARGRQLAQHGGVDPARAQAPRARRAAAAQPCGDWRLVRADGAVLECAADTVRVERQAPAAAPIRGRGNPSARRLRGLYPPTTPSQQVKGGARMPAPMANDPLAGCSRGDVPIYDHSSAILPMILKLLGESRWRRIGCLGD